MTRSAILHFTVGPVQGFVAQARRTRDFWAGSYILSELAATAMTEVEASGGKILFPFVDGDPMLAALRRRRKGGEALLSPGDRAARVGAIPNRFKALVPDGVDGDVCAVAVHAEWSRMAEAVWEKVAASGPSKAIWNRQIDHTWETSWVLAEDGAALDQRKHLRTWQPAAEGGEKCTLCGERQEISGQADRRAVRQWWSDLRLSLQQQGWYELTLNERLCGVCLTKRLFPRVAEQAVGWRVPVSFPSVVFMSAVDWLERLLAAPSSETVPFVQAAVGAGIPMSERQTRLRGLDSLVVGKEDVAPILDLDGSAFYVDRLQSQEEWMQDPGKVAPVAEELRKLYRKFGQPSPFYALLVMDGDGMGRILGALGEEDQQRVSLAVSDFSRGVEEIVAVRNGYLIYAGGDDVLALLPVGTALDCAAALRRKYRDAFAQVVREHLVADAQATISAAVVFAHYTTPLTAVIRDGHTLLDAFAKDLAGRDAIACRVWKRGGPALTWAQPWTTALRDPADAPATWLEALQKKFSESDDYSSHFLYRLRDTFDIVRPGGEEPDRQEALMAILLAEYLANRELKWERDTPLAEKRRIARERLAPLLAQCTPVRRSVDERGEPHFAWADATVDAALLVRFLAQKEV